MRTNRLRPRIVDGRCRVALPKEVLRELGVAAGDYVAFELLGDQVLLRKIHLTVAA